LIGGAQEPTIGAPPPAIAMPAHHRAHGPLARLASRTYRNAYLLAVLLLVIFVRPFVAGTELGTQLGSLLLDLLLYASLLTGALAAAEHPRHAVGVWALAGLSVSLRLHWRASGEDGVLTAFLASAAVLHGAVAVMLLRSLFRRRSGIDADTLQGAVAVYLLLGVTWTFAFALLEHTVPGSFALPAAEGDPAEQFERLIGFSFTTLTTLGYGNVHPATPQADALATAEAITGVFYVGVLVARLIGIQIAEHSAPPGPGGREESA
jgi:hypothetical protein